MAVLCIFQDCKYARVLNFEAYIRFVYFRKYDRILVLDMRRDAIMEGFWILKDSEYAKFQNMQLFWL